MLVSAVIDDGGDVRGPITSGTEADSLGDLVRAKPPAPTLERGRTIGRYVVLYELGSGGMGVVYAAYDPELDRKVALKLLHADSTSTRGRQRLMREAKAIAKLSHPNVVTVHDVGTYEGRVFVAMEYVDGVTLRQWLRERARPWPEALAVLCAAGAGLAAAHAAELIHRDFKPDNVLVDRRGRVVVLDFGLARRAQSRDDDDASASRSNHSLRRASRELDAVPERDRPPGGPEAPKPGDLDAELTRTGALLGTPAYMAPEQHLGNLVDARSDQFSFCVVLWEAVYGVRPFRGESATSTAVSVVRGMLEEPPRGTGVPSWLRRVLTRGLSVDPSARFPDVHVLLAELHRVRARRLRRRIATASAVVGACAIASLAFVLVTRDATACTHAALRMVGVWDDEIRGELRGAFERSGATYAETAATSVTQTLDGYAQRWIQQHREACEATHVHKEQSQELLDLRMACLRARLGELDALVDELVAADANVVEHAVEAASGLGRVELCDDPGALTASGWRSTPTNPNDAERVESLRERLADARAKEAAGRYEAAQIIAEEVQGRAGVLEFAPLSAEVQLRLGSVLEKRGEFEQAEHALLEAVWQADAAHHDELGADAWVRLVWVTGVERSDVETGELWSRFADAAVRRAGDDELARATLVHNQGGLRYRQRRLEEAFSLYREALEAQRRLLGPDDPVVAMTLNHMGNVKIEQADYATAREYVTRSLELRKRVLGAMHPKVAASINNLAAIDLRLQHFDDALARADEALAIVRGTGGMEESIALDIAIEAATGTGNVERRAREAERLVELRERTGSADPGPIAAAVRALAAAREAQQRDADAVSLLERAAALQRSGDPNAAARALLEVERVQRRRGDQVAGDDARSRARALAGTASTRDEALLRRLAAPSATVETLLGE
ncbi:MAG: serine/threonine protein kinase [Deltaproteobacteria bacterium]|nr:serine/threonine protein kinase [Deltaproteobacteria bacterium]MBK8714327.1 serine/threonine protein kinase [Deltaproteobacteria bacterium]MBP7285885.1 serine/threonine protein kinase [Nannocystaceae bacterium]